MRTQLLRISFVSVLLLVLNGCSSIPGMGGDSSGTAALIGKLTSQLGVSNEQALGGTAALFELAKNKLSADDFSSVTSALPGVGSMLGKLPTKSSDSANNEQGMAGVANKFSKLGMDTGMLGKFVPVVLDYAKSSGGDKIKDLLQGVFK